ncbi:LytTR family DNA-binding domain-containing protein [Spirosoma sp. KNUC1025]|uniref:LytR/AlgR family response regulator transcription factor n=1 Tax=Spirosoma sp. KNUC1025 TaxID=2894082 RepID=UPI001E5907E0|nr:LytTR family DNA-binding domain-containing protein [Spirosoma sp. KNUC1025]UFH57992.1 LytTR family transcriptional regulator [Spirosoma sp. KNUC1025]
MVTPSQDDLPDHVPGYRLIHDAQRIVRLEGKGNYTLVYLLDHARPILVSYTLKRFEAHLPTYIRIHRSALINPAYVSQVSRATPRLMFVKLTTGESMPVSRHRMQVTSIRLNRKKPVRFFYHFSSLPTF